MVRRMCAYEMGDDLTQSNGAAIRMHTLHKRSFRCDWGLNGSFYRAVLAKGNFSKPEDYVCMCVFKSASETELATSTSTNPIAGSLRCHFWYLPIINAIVLPLIVARCIHTPLPCKVFIITKLSF